MGTFVVETSSNRNPISTIYHGSELYEIYCVPVLANHPIRRPKHGIVPIRLGTKSENIRHLEAMMLVSDCDLPTLQYHQRELSVEGHRELYGTLDMFLVSCHLLAVSQLKTSKVLGFQPPSVLC